VLGSGRLFGSSGVRATFERRKRRVWRHGSAWRRLVAVTAAAAAGTGAQATPGQPGTRACAARRPRWAVPPGALHPCLAARRRGTEEAPKAHNRPRYTTAVVGAADHRFFIRCAPDGAGGGGMCWEKAPEGRHTFLHSVCESSASACGLSPCPNASWKHSTTSRLGRCGSNCHSRRNSIPAMVSRNTGASGVEGREAGQVTGVARRLS
jgi:hypothetical protein